MTTFKTSIEINASLETVYEALTSLEKYPEWHPGIKKIFGSVEQGQWLTAYFGKGKRSVKIPLHISVLQKNKSLEWQGSLFKKGMFRKYFLVRHAFYVEDIGNGKTKFTNEEEFSKLLSKPVKRIENKFIQGYERVNLALKNYCETQSR